MPSTPRFYNTLTRSVEDFTPIEEGHARLYVCGPTIYNIQHIGNFRAFVFADTLRRALEANHLRVTHVMNITDVGHLTDDASDGEDKIEMAARKGNESVWDLVKRYTDIFLVDWKDMNLEAPHVMPRATDHIPEQIAMIQTMEDKGFTYTTSDGVYFDTSKLPEYGKLSGQKLEDKQEGARIGINEERKNPTDFALWKFSKKDEKRQMEWESPWGVGFPGWHLECSAMSEKYLGVPFDIHTGGIDHIAVHHENEIAQTMAARGVLEANAWMHNGFLTVDNGKMSKSLGNTYSMAQLAEKGIEPLAYRLFCLGAHYKTTLNFTWEAVQAAQNAYDKLTDAVREWDKPSEAEMSYVERVRDCVNDDLNTPEALAVMWELVKDDSHPTSIKAATLLKIDEMLGLALEDVVARPIKIPADVKKLLADREQARADKDWTQSDALRDQIAAEGFEVKDTPEGQKLREIKK